MKRVFISSQAIYGWCEWLKCRYGKILFLFIECKKPLLWRLRKEEMHAWSHPLFSSSTCGASCHVPFLFLIILFSRSLHIAVGVWQCCAVSLIYSADKQSGQVVITELEMGGAVSEHDTFIICILCFVLCIYCVWLVVAGRVAASHLEGVHSTAAIFCFVCFFCISLNK